MSTLVMLPGGGHCCVCSTMCHHIGPVQLCNVHSGHAVERIDPARPVPPREQSGLSAIVVAECSACKRMGVLMQRVTGPGGAELSPPRWLCLDSDTCIALTRRLSERALASESAGAAVGARPGSADGPTVPEETAAPAPTPGAAPAPPREVP